MTPNSTDKLKQLGFVVPGTEVPHRLIASIHGEPKSGKTHLALTAPAPIFFFSIDTGTEGVIEKFRALGKDIFMWTPHLNRKARQVERTQEENSKVWLDFKVRFAACVEISRGTIVIDSATEWWELARLKEFGKLSQVRAREYGSIKAEVKEMIRDVYEDTDMNLILVHRLRDVYRNDARTGERAVAGMPDIEYETQANIVTSREDHPDNGGPPTFSATITDCRRNLQMIGRVFLGGEMDFELILSRIHA